MTISNSCKEASASALLLFFFETAQQQIPLSLRTEEVGQAIFSLFQETPKQDYLFTLHSFQVAIKQSGTSTLLALDQLAKKHLVIRSQQPILLKALQRHDLHRQEEILQKLPSFYQKTPPIFHSSLLFLLQDHAPCEIEPWMELLIPLLSKDPELNFFFLKDLLTAIKKAPFSERLGILQKTLSLYPNLGLFHPSSLAPTFQALAKTPKKERESLIASSVQLSQGKDSFLLLPSLRKIPLEQRDLIVHLAQAFAGKASTEDLGALCLFLCEIAPSKQEALVQSALQVHPYFPMLNILDLLKVLSTVLPEERTTFFLEIIPLLSTTPSIQTLEFLQLAAHLPGKDRTNSVFSSFCFLLNYCQAYDLLECLGLSFPLRIRREGKSPYPPISYWKRGAALQKVAKLISTNQGKSKEPIDLLQALHQIPQKQWDSLLQEASPLFMQYPQEKAQMITMLSSILPQERANVIQHLLSLSQKVLQEDVVPVCLTLAKIPRDRRKEILDLFISLNVSQIDWEMFPEAWSLFSLFSKEKRIELFAMLHRFPHFFPSVHLQLTFFKIMSSVIPSQRQHVFEQATSFLAIPKIPTPSIFLSVFAKLSFEKRTQATRLLGSFWSHPLGSWPLDLAERFLFHLLQHSSEKEQSQFEHIEKLTRNSLYSSLILLAAHAISFHEITDSLLEKLFVLSKPELLDLIKALFQIPLHQRVDVLEKTLSLEAIDLEKTTELFLVTALIPSEQRTPQNLKILSSLFLDSEIPEALSTFPPKELLSFLQTWYPRIKDVPKVTRNEVIQQLAMLLPKERVSLLERVQKICQNKPSFFSSYLQFALLLPLSYDLHKIAHNILILCEKESSNHLIHFLKGAPAEDRLFFLENPTSFLSIFSLDSPMYIEEARKIFSLFRQEEKKPELIQLICSLYSNISCSWNDQRQLFEIVQSIPLHQRLPLLQKATPFLQAIAKEKKKALALQLLIPLLQQPHAELLLQQADSFLQQEENAFERVILLSLLGSIPKQEQLALMALVPTELSGWKRVYLLKMIHLLPKSSWTIEKLLNLTPFLSIQSLPLFFSFLEEAPGQERTHSLLQLETLLQKVKSKTDREITLKAFKAASREQRRSLILLISNIPLVKLLDFEQISLALSFHPNNLSSKIDFLQKLWQGSYPSSFVLSLEEELFPRITIPTLKALSLPPSLENIPAPPATVSLQELLQAGQNEQDPIRVGCKDLYERITLQKEFVVMLGNKQDLYEKMASLTRHLLHHIQQAPQDRDPILTLLSLLKGRCEGVISELEILYSVYCLKKHRVEGLEASLQMIGFFIRQDLQVAFMEAHGSYHLGNLNDVHQNAYFRFLTSSHLGLLPPLKEAKIETKQTKTLANTFLQTFYLQYPLCLMEHLYELLKGKKPDFQIQLGEEYPFFSKAIFLDMLHLGLLNDHLPKLAMRLKQIQEEKWLPLEEEILALSLSLEELLECVRPLSIDLLTQDAPSSEKRILEQLILFPFCRKSVSLEWIALYLKKKGWLQSIDHIQEALEESVCFAAHTTQTLGD